MCYWKSWLLVGVVLVACRASPEERREEESRRRALAEQADVVRYYEGVSAAVHRMDRAEATRYLKLSDEVLGDHRDTFREKRVAYVKACERCASARTCEDEARRIEAVGVAAVNDVVCR